MSENQQLHSEMSAVESKCISKDGIKVHHFLAAVVGLVNGFSVEWPDLLLPVPLSELTIRPHYPELLAALAECEFKSLLAEVEEEAARLLQGLRSQGSYFKKRCPCGKGLRSGWTFLSERGWLEKWRLLKLGCLAALCPPYSAAMLALGQVWIVDRQGDCYLMTP